MLAAAATLTACEGSREPVAANGASSPVSAAPEPDRPVLPAALDREQLLVAMLEAATAAALGEVDGEAQQALKGRRFQVWVRFGCPGEVDTRRNWRFDEAAGALRVKVTPDSLASLDGTSANESEEATKDGDPARGFLIPRPVLLRSGCPASEYSALPSAPGLSFGLLPLHLPDARRDEALLPSYEIVKKIAPDAVPNQGLDLILSGRLDSEGDTPVIRCAPAGNAIQCLATATFDTISIEDPATKRMIAEWSGR